MDADIRLQQFENSDRNSNIEHLAYENVVGLDDYFLYTIFIIKKITCESGKY